MQRLVHVLGLMSPASHPFVVNPMAAAINPLNPESLSLTEDGLALLLVLLRNAPSAGSLIPVAPGEWSLVGG